MQNYIQKGEVLPFIAAADLVSGQGLLLNDLFGVVAADTLTGEEGNLAITGVYSLPMAAVTVTQFSKAYWDDTAKKVTNVATANTLIGVFADAAASGAAEVGVRLNG